MTYPATAATAVAPTAIASFGSGEGVDEGGVEPEDMVTERDDGTKTVRGDAMGDGQIAGCWEGLGAK